jgi:hypothetical protein
MMMGKIAVAALMMELEPRQIILEVVKRDSVILVMLHALKAM